MEFRSSSLGTRVWRKHRQRDASIRKQQFIICICPPGNGPCDSDELVLIQGIIDAYLEEEDGLVPIDLIKGDHVPEGSPGTRGKDAGRGYRVQLDYYERIDPAD